MKDSSDVSFTNDYQPGEDACVELFNGRFVDVANDDYFCDNVKVIIKGERVAAMPGAERQPSDIMTMDQLAAIAGQASKRNLKSTIHHTSVDFFRRALKAGVSSLAHIPWDGLLTADDIALFLAQKAFIEPTMSVSYDSC